ncbi:MAG: hypothetical protein R3A49_03855 [Acidimicrobiia bacterium]
MLPGRNHATVADPVGGTPRDASWTGSVLAVGARPDLWWTALRVAVGLSPRGWWRRPPYLPVPSRGYLRFRALTAYGRDRPPSRHDIVDYLAWCRDLSRCRAGRS